MERFAEVAWLESQPPPCRQMVGVHSKHRTKSLSLKVCVHAILRRHLVPPAVLNEVGVFFFLNFVWMVGWKGMNIFQEHAFFFTS